MALSRIRQDRNAEKEPCACGFTRQGVLNRNLERPEIEGNRQKEKNLRRDIRTIELTQLNLPARSTGWTKVSQCLMSEEVSCGLRGRPNPGLIELEVMFR